MKLWLRPSLASSLDWLFASLPANAGGAVERDRPGHGGAGQRTLWPLPPGVALSFFWPRVSIQ